VAEHIIHRPLGLALIGAVGGQEDGVFARRHLAQGLLPLAGIPPRDRDQVAVGQQPLRDAPADAP
jgi:hypothetical protein